MKRRAKAWVIRGTDGSLISKPHWWPEHAQAKCPIGCKVIPVIVTYDDGKVTKRRKRGI